LPPRSGRFCGGAAISIGRAEVPSNPGSGRRMKRLMISGGVTAGAQLLGIVATFAGPWEDTGRPTTGATMVPAIQVFQSPADQGNTKAQGLLGVKYRRDKGVARNSVAAFNGSARSRRGARPEPRRNCARIAGLQHRRQRLKQGVEWSGIAGEIAAYEVGRYRCAIHEIDVEGKLTGLGNFDHIRGRRISAHAGAARHHVRVGVGED
jgi:hypothetical protein